MNFSSTTQRNFSLSFSSVMPSLSSLGSFLSGFTAAGAGTFAADPAPTSTVTASPEPSTFVLIGGGAAVSLLGRGRRRFKTDRKRDLA